MQRSARQPLTHIDYFTPDIFSAHVLLRANHKKKQVPAWALFLPFFFKSGTFFFSTRAEESRNQTFDSFQIYLHLILFIIFRLFWDNRDFI